jgi:hypothetical protein
MREACKLASDKEQRKHCIQCGCVYDKNHRYCARCGAPVSNRCLDPGDALREPCGHVNGDDAAFCVKCGSVTAFNKAGLRPSHLPEAKVLETDELQEMNWFSHKFFMD